MFRKKHYLSKEERQALLVIQQQFADATLRRSSEGSPADFYANIACLREYAEVSAAFTKIMAPHLSKMLDAGEKAWHSPMKFLGLVHFGGEFYSQNKAVKEAYKILLSGYVQDTMKTEFAKEPRITGLNARESHRESVADEGKGVVTMKRDDNYDYTITFSDNTTLVLHTLDDEKLLAEAKEVFETKMQELSLGHRLMHG